MRRHARLTLLSQVQVVTFLLGPLATFAYADGGTLQVSQQLGDVQIAVFTDPAPLRAGAVDVSVWAQHAQSSQLADVEINVTAHNRTTRQELTARATREAATNKLLQAAKFELPSGGDWQFDIEVRPRETTDLTEPGRVSFTAQVEPRLPRWRELAGWILWPIVPVVLFGAHVYLAERSKQTRRSATQTSAAASSR